MVERSVAVRIGVAGAAQTKVEFTGIGAAGQKALSRVAQAATPVSHALRGIDSAASDVRGGLEELASRAGILGRAAGAMGPVGLGVAAAVAGIGLAAGGAVVGLTKLMQSVVGVSREFETYGAVLETTEGSAAAARKALDWVSEFAAKTPYELGETTQAFVKMRAYGLEPMGGLLQTLGDTASAMGKPLEQAVEAIADAVTGENERLKEFGIKARKEGGKITYEYTQNGKTLTRVADESNRAMITSTLQAIWNDRYSGAMAKRAATWDGMTSNLSDAWARFRLRIGEAGPFNALRDVLSRTLGYIESLDKSGALTRIAQAIGEPIARAVKVFTANIDDMIAKAGGIEAVGVKIEGVVRRFMGELLGSGDDINKFGDVAQARIGDLGKTLGNLGQIIDTVAAAIRGLSTAWAAVDGVVSRYSNLSIKGPQFSFERPSWMGKSAAPATAPAPTIAAPIAGQPAPSAVPRPSVRTPASMESPFRVGGSVDINITSPSAPVRAVARPGNKNVPLKINQGLTLPAR